MLPSRHQVSAAAHASLPHANPLSLSQMTALAQWAVSHHPTTAIDIGCGPGSFAVALATLAPVSVRAIDPNSIFIERGRLLAQSCALVGDIEFLARPLQDDEETKFDLVACIGSSESVGGARQALQYCKTLLNSNGLIVFGELVWMAVPPQEFLSFLGVGRDYYWSQSDSEQVFSELGLSLIHQCDASPSSWGHYERAVLDGRLKLASTLDALAADLLCTRAITWYDHFEKYGKFCLGFTAYVAQHAQA